MGAADVKLRYRKRSCRHHLATFSFAPNGCGGRLLLNSAIPAAVTFDPAVTRPESLVEAIRETGYGAELPSNERTAFEEGAVVEQAPVEAIAARLANALVRLKSAA